MPALLYVPPYPTEQIGKWGPTSFRVVSMISTTSPLALQGTHLVRILSELAAAEVMPSHRQFVTRLGRYVSIHDSITLSSVLASPVAKDFQPEPVLAADISALFRRARRDVVVSIVQGFAPDARIPVPMIPGEPLVDLQAAYEPWHRFYAAHQRELDAAVQRLQGEVRDAVGWMSAELARLVALDRELGGILAAPARQLLGVIPRLLRRRFEVLCGETQAVGGTPTDWHDAFCRELKGVLLAEAEVRLLPIMGLIEAAETEAANKE